MTAVPCRAAMVLVLAGAAPVSAAPDWFQIDPVHTRVLFFVDHAGYSRSIGLFRPVEGGFWFDADDWSRGRVELCLPLTHLDMGDRRWEDTLRGRSFFHAARHPELCLRSGGSSRSTPAAGGFTAASACAAQAGRWCSTSRSTACVDRRWTSGSASASVRAPSFRGMISAWTATAT